ncbi:MAG: hypothetical protein NW220_04125 [Leptolyngbyaceae cyanobacterium bins.349]|nr:hypothetical protein [Leptolyngbyaceae cyanobacterium bins.349]
MADESKLLVPENLSFEAALGITQELLDRGVAGALTGAEWETAIARLVATENGARGFFVVYLSDARAQMDTLMDRVMAALSTAPDVISSLLVKNLAMSTAMAIAHRRNQNEDLAQGSERVRARSLHLIQTLQTQQLQQEATALATSIATATGSYASFLQRWGYDAEQRQAIAQVLQETGLGA